jgi:hypothetical protein
MRRYFCDGVRDCKDGEDEYEKECGKYIIFKELCV